MQKNTPKKAIVLLNMGGASSLNEVEIFLKNMFNDPYILPIKSDFFRKILANFITHKRLEESQNNYKKIGGKSPIIEHTFKLCQTLESLDESYFYTYAMRYTPPFANMVAKELQSKNIQEIVLFSMYPHFSYTTTQSSYEDFLYALKTLNYHPKIHFIKNYFDDLDYNKAIIHRIKESLNNEDSNDFHLIFSAPSLPQKNIDRGDPYQKEILANVNILKKLLPQEGLNFASIQVAYQSKLGPIKWLEPSLENTLKKYKNKKVIIYPIAFSMDNSETDFELSIQYKEVSQNLGILDYRVARCLNDSKEFANFIIKKGNECTKV